jgi:hypothetical protein
MVTGPQLRQVSVLAVLIGLVGCGSDYPSVEAIRPDMEKAVQAAVRALGSEPELTAVLHARCTDNHRGVDGDLLQIGQFGFPRPDDLTSRLRTVSRELKSLGLTDGSASESSTQPLLVMHQEDRPWTLVVTTAATGGLVVDARGVVDEDDVPGDLLPKNLCG